MTASGRSGAAPAHFGIGEAVPRAEDDALLRGEGRFADDVTVPGMLFACIVRSPYAHARIVAFDASAAQAAPGVNAVLSGKDYAADGVGNLPCVSLPSHLAKSAFVPPFPALAHERVRYVGQAVALVVANTRWQALDAAELVSVDYEPLPVVPDLDGAASGARAVWDECPDNVAFTFELGDADATERALSTAAHIIRHRLVNQRLAGNPLEPRACIGEYDAQSGRYQLLTGTQTPHRVRRLLAESIFGVPLDQVQVRSGDVGGGFGTKGNLYPEEVLVLWASRRTARPVKWVASRTESFQCDFQGRDQVADAELALDRDGRFLALRVVSRHNLGSQLAPSGAYPPIVCARMLSGCYRIPAMHVTAQGVFTHTVPTTPYRGAGRPEATFVIERMIDLAAAEVAIDRVELRRRNLIQSGDMPYRTATGENYDCGDFPAVLDAALELGDWAGYPRRLAESRDAGRLRGRGLAMFVEVSAVLGERMEIHLHAGGLATVMAGTSPQGQGHATTYRQMLVEWLGLAFDAIDVVHGDTEKIKQGLGTYAARSMVVGGSALRAAADDLIAQGRVLAAQLLKCEPGELQFTGGRFRHPASGPDVDWTGVAAARAEAGESFPLVGTGAFEVQQQNYPNGCQVVEVEIDPGTGELELARFSAVDDVGRVLNPLLYTGQIQGGIVQGAGQALFEQVRFDADGQLMTNSFVDYTMPRAADFPRFQLGTHNVPTRTNPLGVKGAGESGTIGAAAAIVNATVDALASIGVADMAMPATPETIWKAIRAAGGSNPGSTEC